MCNMLKRQLELSAAALPALRQHSVFQNLALLLVLQLRASGKA